MKLPVCVRCASDKVFAIEPGEETVYAELTKIPIRAGKPARAWCLHYWPFGIAQGDLVAEARR